MEKPWKKEKKSEKFIRQLFTLIPMLVFGGVIGFFSTKYSVDITDKIPTPLMIFLMILFLFITFILQVIIHETGHLVMGLLTGYEFLFYRIFRLLFIKENGKLKIRWHKNGSVAGQCCLYPPKMSNPEKAEYPFFWYHAGGLLFNLIFSIISIVLLFRFHPGNILFYPFFVPLAGWGILLFFQNAYPYSKTFTNDGSNIRRMKRSSASRLFFYNQIRSAASFSNGKHIKDMPVEEFLPKSKDHYGNDFFVYVMEYTIYGDYLSSQGKYREALEQYSTAIPYFNQVPEQTKNLLLLQYLFLLIVNDAPLETVNGSMSPTTFNL